MTTQFILIIGTGALATLFAARLSATGVDVTMLGTWQAGLDALRKEGARLAAADGVERAYPVRVIYDPAECRRARFALVLVKAWQTERAARQLTSCLAEDGLALLKAPVRRVTVPDVPIPYSPPLEAELTVTAAKIAAGVMHVLGR